MLQVSVLPRRVKWMLAVSLQLGACILISSNIESSRVEFAPRCNLCDSHRIASLAPRVWYVKSRRWFSWLSQQNAIRNAKISENYDKSAIQGRSTNQNVCLEHTLLINIHYQRSTGRFHIHTIHICMYIVHIIEIAADLKDLPFFLSTFALVLRHSARPQLF